jgi:hypothetical protein
MAIHDLVDVIVERPLILLPVIACIIIYAFSGRPDSVYDNYEQLKNPWWLPNLLGKGPHVLFSEGYNNVGIFPSCGSSTIAHNLCRLSFPMTSLLL